MRSLVRSIALVIMALLILSSPAMAQKGQFAVPENAELDKFPIFSVNKPLTTEQVAKMELRPVVLDHEVVVQNHFRNLQDASGRLVVERLKVGTLVYVDKYGNIRYKVDCGNRLVEFANVAINRKPAPAELKPAPKPPAPPQNLHTNNESGFWKGVKALWSHFIDALRPAANWLGWLMGWGAIWLLIAMILFALYESARGWGQETGYPPLPGTAPRPAQQVGQPLATPPATATAQPQPAAQPVAPVPAPATAEAEPVTDHAANSTRSRLQFNPQSGTTPAMIRTSGRITLVSVEHGENEHVIRYRH